MADTKKLAEQALNDKEEVKNDVHHIVFTSGFDCESYRLGVANSRERITVSTWVDRGPTQTEQIHAASISEQIRSGQGSADTEVAKDYYDFPDGKDDGSEGVGVFDMSEPAEAFEREQQFKADLKRDLSLQMADRAKKQASDASKKGSSGKNTTQAQSAAENQSTSASDSKSE